MKSNQATGWHFKALVMAATLGIGVSSGSVILADESKLDQPQDLSAQVIDNGATKDGASAGKGEEVAQQDNTGSKGEDEAHEVPHAAGHAFQ